MEPRYPELEQILLQQPFDRDTLLIYADWLQECGDPRGQLISLQLRREQPAGSGEGEHISAATRELIERHRERFVPAALREIGPALRLDWSGGFVRRLHMTEAWTPVVANGRLAEVFAHPSLRFAVEVDVDLGGDERALRLVMRALVDAPLPGVRRLVFSPAPMWVESGSDSIAPLVAALPWLESVATCTGIAWKTVAHPRLRSLALVYTDPRERAAALRALPACDLPALLSLQISHLAPDDFRRVAAILSSGCARGLRTLILDRSRSTDALAAVLVDAAPELELLDLREGDLTIGGARTLAGRTVRLARLCVRNNPLPPAVRSVLEPITAELDLGPDADLAGNWYVRHRVRTEWGLGRVLSSDGRTATVAFEDGQSRTIQRIARFLQAVDEQAVAPDSRLRPPPAAPRPPPGPHVTVLAKALEVGLRALVLRLHHAGRIDSWLRHELDRGGKLLAVDAAVLAGGGKGDFRRLRAPPARTLLRRMKLADVISDLRAWITSLQREPRNVRLETVADWQDADARLAAIAACEQAGAVVTEGELHRMVAAATPAFVPSYLLHCAQS